MGSPLPRLRVLLPAGFGCWLLLIGLGDPAAVVPAKAAGGRTDVRGATALSELLPQTVPPPRLFLPVAANTCAPTVTVNPSSQPLAGSGTTFMFTGVCFTPGTGLARYFVDPLGVRRDLSPITTDAGGRFTAPLTLTGCWPFGTYTYVARENATGRTTASPFTLTPGPGNCTRASVVREESHA